MLLLSGCAAQRKGCGDWQDVSKHDRSKFRVMKTQKVRGQWYVEMKNDYGKKVATFCACEQLPDSVREGNYITLPNVL